ncbi:signal peptide, CUB and EGF-like domain-containing protein 3 [Exaiptasia diaphana]|uniref:Ig-like domain-containing protein n=1 Tax=Exaiptasia diaphana TaxID=2652724 RepID=A0A913Y2X5_EXADI|nr:signal peptide, CUB and EGF-like domain-containing protein 3 [Exaiptasia diaphana]
MCAAGTYQDKRGQTTCNKCPSGTSSLEGDFVCRDFCPAGTFSKDGMSPFCTLCPQGQYQDQTGQTKCTVCPQNKFTNTKLGATSCQDVKPTNQQQNGLLEITSVKKPKKWRPNDDTLECNIKDNNYKLVSVQWKIINKGNIPVDFLGKPKYEEIRNDSAKLVGSRLVLSNVTPHNARLDYVCVAANVNGETRKTA